MIPEKIITIMGLAIDIIITAPVHKFKYLIVSLDRLIIVIIKMGAIFCHLIIVYSPRVFKVVITFGTQKCIGAAPNFIIIPNKINKHDDVLLSDIIALLIRIIDPTL